MPKPLIRWNPCVGPVGRVAGKCGWPGRWQAMTWIWTSPRCRLEAKAARGNGRSRRRRRLRPAARIWRNNKKRLVPKKSARRRGGKRKEWGVLGRWWKESNVKGFGYLNIMFLRFAWAQVIKGVGGVEFMAALGDVSYRWQHLILRCRCCKYERGLSSEPLG